jgi:hypothetical protein
VISTTSITKVEDGYFEIVFPDLTTDTAHSRTVANIKAMAWYQRRYGRRFVIPLGAIEWRGL